MNRSDRNDLFKFLSCALYIIACIVIANCEESIPKNIYDILHLLFTAIIPLGFILFCVIYACIYLYRYWLSEKMPALFSFKARRNLKRLEQYFIATLLDVCNKNNIPFYLCRDPLVNQLRLLSKTKASVADASRWSTNFNYFELSYRLIYSFSFDLVSSGKYHIYRGMLSVQGEALHLICKHALHYALIHGAISAQDHDEQLDILVENIANVG